MVLAILPQTWTLPHYLAPVTGLFLLFAVQGVRYLSLWRREADRLGGALAAAIPFVLVAMILLRVGAAAMHVPLESAWPRGNLERGAIMDQLSKAGGRHLILVAYAPTHDVNQEWVYNRADIDSSSVVWARDMGEEENRKLLAYFRDRRVWLLHPDQQPVGLVSVTP